MNKLPERCGRNSSFIRYLFDQCQKDKGFAARLRRASNPATEYQCWDILATFGINLENQRERQIYALVGAALANSREAENGTLSPGKAIAQSFPDGNKDKQAIARLRRLLACTTAEEACLILRPLLTLIQSRASQGLDYAQLLDDLVWFGENTRARWAQQFYARAEQEAGEI